MMEAKSITKTRNRKQGACNKVAQNQSYKENRRHLIISERSSIRRERLGLHRWKVIRDPGN